MSELLSGLVEIVRFVAVLALYTPGNWKLSPLERELAREKFRRRK